MKNLGYKKDWNMKNERLEYEKFSVSYKDWGLLDTL